LPGSFNQLAWDDITEPGAYVDVATGDLYRIPQEGLLKGASPLIRKESATQSSLVQLSKNPYAPHAASKRASPPGAVWRARSAALAGRSNTCRVFPVVTERLVIHYWR